MTKSLNRIVVALLVVCQLSDPSTAMIVQPAVWHPVYSPKPADFAEQAIVEHLINFYDLFRRQSQVKTTSYGLLQRSPFGVRSLRRHHPITDGSIEEVVSTEDDIAFDLFSGENPSADQMRRYHVMPPLYAPEGGGRSSRVYVRHANRIFIKLSEGRDSATGESRAYVWLQPVEGGTNIKLYIIQPDTIQPATAQEAGEIEALIREAKTLQARRDSAHNKSPAPRPSAKLLRYLILRSRSARWNMMYSGIANDLAEWGYKVSKSLIGLWIESDKDLAALKAEVMDKRWMNHAVSNPIPGMSPLERKPKVRKSPAKPQGSLPDGIGPTDANKDHRRHPSVGDNPDDVPAPARPPMEIIDRERVDRSNLKAIVFDFDDTLWKGFPLDLEISMALRWLTGQEEHSPEAFAELLAHVRSTLGWSWAERAQSYRDQGRYSPSDVGQFNERLHAAIDEKVRATASNTPAHLIAGTVELLDALKRRGLKMAILTGGKARSREQLSRDLGIRPFFNPIVGEGRKTEALTKLTKWWGLDPDEVAMFGDGSRDMEAAVASNVLGIGIAATPADRERLILAGAHVIINGDYTQSTGLLQELRLGAGSSPATATLDLDGIGPTDANKDHRRHPSVGDNPDDVPLIAAPAPPPSKIKVDFDKSIPEKIRDRVRQIVANEALGTHIFVAASKRHLVVRGDITFLFLSYDEVKAFSEPIILAERPFEPGYRVRDWRGREGVVADVFPDGRIRLEGDLFMRYWPSQLIRITEVPAGNIRQASQSSGGNLRITKMQKIDGKPLQQLRESGVAVAHLVGWSLGFPESFVEQMLGRTDLQFYVSSGQSNAGHDRIRIYRQAHIKLPLQMLNLLLTLASEYAHRFHQVLIEQDPQSPHEVSGGVAESFDWIARQSILRLISPHDYALELRSLRRDAACGGVLIQALRTVSLLPEEFKGGDTPQSRRVLNKAAELIKANDPGVTEASLRESMITIAGDFVYQLGTGGFRATGAPHLFGAVLANMVLRWSKYNAIRAARMLGKSLTAEPEAFGAFNDFYSLLLKLKTQNIRLFDLGIVFSRSTRKWRQFLKSRVSNMHRHAIYLPISDTEQPQGISRFDKIGDMVNHAVGSHFPDGGGIIWGWNPKENPFTDNGPLHSPAPNTAPLQSAA
jgi:phosphoglycolate phosphatase-like HAD superfamily hydrolase